MRLHSSDLEAITRSLMEAAVDPSLWGNAMDHMARLSHSTGAALIPVLGRMPNLPHSSSLADGFGEYFREGWHLRDQREGGLPTMRARGYFVDQDFASSGELRSSDYYRGFLARYDCNWSMGIGVNTGGDEWCLILQRGDRAGMFDESEQKQLIQLAAPMNQSALLSRHLSFGRAAGMNEAFTLLGCASILLDRSGKVFQLNKEAEAYLGDRLLLNRGELSCFKPDETKELRKLIHELCFATDESFLKHPRSVVISGRSSTPLVIQGVRLRSSVTEVFNCASALLFIVDPFRGRPPAPADEVRQVLGLTKAEANLLALLEADTPLPQAADRLGVSYETARSQLKQIFRRTGTKRQSEVLNLVRRMVLRLKSGG